MEWTDEAIVLTARPHGENAAIAMLLSATHGRHAGLIPGGQSARAQSTLQPGTLVQAQWRARLLDHLGTYTLDVETAFGARWLDSPEILALIASATAMADVCLPERQPMGGVYAGLLSLLSLNDPDLWGPVYVKWEMELLRALGYGLDLTCCAVTGAADTKLTHVSPRTGRAVGSQAAAPYENRLLPLPGFLCGASDWGAADILAGLNLTGHFLTRSSALAHSYGQMGADVSPFPPARARLAAFYRSLSDKEALQPTTENKVA